MNDFNQRNTKIAITLMTLTLLNNAGCQEEDIVLPPSVENLSSRRVATTYQIQLADPEQKASCYQLLENRSRISTKLSQNDFVDLVNITEGMYRYQGEFWLHVHPRLTHRPSCYINVRYLVPYA